MKNLLQKIEAVVIKIEQYAETVTSAGAIALSAVDPHQLPPKYAAIVVGASNFIRPFNKALPLVQAKTQKAFAEGTALLGHLRLSEKASNAEPAGGTPDSTTKLAA